jgi:hypothetical protein
MRRGETQSDVSRSPDLLMKQLVLHRSLLSIRQSCRGRLLADGGDIANLGYCVTGTEGSNPSLSTIQPSIFSFAVKFYEIVTVRSKRP